MQVKFHPDKCHVLHLGHSNPRNPYRGDRQGLDAVTSEKGFGITIHQQLKFSDHIEWCVKKANRVLGILGCIARTFCHLHKETSNIHPVSGPLEQVQ